MEATDTASATSAPEPGPRPTADGRVAVLHVGPDATGRGGMPAVIRGLTSSPLASEYRLETLTTWSTADALSRAAVFARAVVKLGRWCVARGPRLVHVHTAMRGSVYRKAVCVVVARSLRRPVLLHVHSGPGDIAAFDERLGPVRGFLLRRAFSAADRVLAVSSATAAEIEARFSVSEVLVVPNAAPIPAERAAAGEPADGAPDRLLYLGGFANPVKGGAVLVDALPAILDAFPKLPVVLAGPGDPPDAFLRLARELPAVTWAGWLDEERKDSAFADCAIFVLPSLSEGLPVALLEAMARGRAIVATTAGGIPDVLSDEQDGLLVEPGRPDLIAAAVIRLAGDPVLRARIGEGASRRAARLNDEDVCGRLGRIYRELAP